jgi:uncharacterized membrane protein YccC
MTRTPFDNVEAAHEYVGLLLEAVQGTREDVLNDLAEEPPAASDERQREALRIVAWKLERLEGHLDRSRRLLNDLRRLRRLLLGVDDPGSQEAARPDDPWDLS